MLSPKLVRLKNLGPPRQYHIYCWPINGFALADPKFWRLKNYKNWVSWGKTLYTTDLYMVLPWWTQNFEDQRIWVSPGKTIYRVLPWQTENFEIENFGSAEARPYVPPAYVWFCLGGPKIWKMKNLGPLRQNHIYHWLKYGFALADPKFLRLKVLGPLRQDHLYHWPIHGFVLADPKCLRLRNVKVYCKI